MKIKKVLNNNAAVIDDFGNEVIVIGKGICFKRKVGELINSNLVEKRFCLSSDEMNLNLQKLIISLPLSEINIVDHIVKNIRMSLTKKISDSIYVSLADHIHYCLKNYNEGIVIRNELINEISKFYSDEFILGQEAVQFIFEETGVEVPIDEAAFIAMHIINAEIADGGGTSNVRKITIIIDEILQIIANYFNLKFDEKSLAYFRLIRHLKYFSRSVVLKNEFTNDPQSEILKEMLKSSYYEAYMCAINIQEFIRVKYKVEVGNEALTYLIIHIQRLLGEKGDYNE